ncbi:hypothetical protein KAH81_04005 [bacterium]|nr:hypothetical protein [bacterium]
MNNMKINKITAGIDWEIPLVDKFSGKSAGKDKIAKLVEKALIIAPELEIGEDIDLVEIRVGMATSYSELRDKTERAFQLTEKLATELKAILVPMGYREADHNPAGGHVHFGSIESFEQAAIIYNRIMPFTPAFVALASSSPSLDGNFKSYRVKLDACGCSQPMTLIDPELSYGHWGSDICIKYPDKATVELRSNDSQPDPQTMCQIATLYIGLCAALLDSDTVPFEPNLIDYGVNRLNACINGMQATFRLKGKMIGISEIVREYILPMAAKGLRNWGLPDNGFSQIESMCEKRISPADWISELTSGIRDPWMFIGEMTRIYSRGSSFGKWLETAETRQEKAFTEPEEILLGSLGVNTPLCFAFQSLPWPRTHTERLADKLVEKGLIRKHLGKKNEILLDRIDLLEKYPD